jgi:heat shock protein HslJ
MKRYVKLTWLFAIIIFMQTACASNAGDAGATGGAKFSDVMDKDWKLMEVRAVEKVFFKTNNGKIDWFFTPRDIIFKRDMLAQESPKDVFTLRFDAERVSGAGCPNRYFAPYTLGEKQDININPMAATLMIALFEPEQLKEHEFFAYLEKVDYWNLVNGNLQLFSTNNEGATMLLVFSLAE